MKKLNLFLHHRDLRLFDNTTLIEQSKNEEHSIPIFIFPPEQIDPKKNKYFSNNSVQFMIESLEELANEISAKNGKLYFFKGDNLAVLKEIHSKIGINSIGFNLDYTPYARKRDDEIRLWCHKEGIKVYQDEDYVLYDILNGQTLKKDGKPYQVFTPFKKYCMTNLKVREVDTFNKFQFKKANELEKIKYHFTKLDTLYKKNNNLNTNGGRKNALEVLNHLDRFKEYNKKRDYFTYKTTQLSAANHFSVISIREFYHRVIKDLEKTNGLINELHWRDFYINITYYYPHILDGQVHKGVNKSFKEKYDAIPWENNKDWFKKWCEGTTGFPIVDASMRQMNQTGFMFNRGRMITCVFLTKNLHIDWRWGEQYFAQKLVDYSPMQNNGGHQWCASTGTDAQPYFRIFNPWTQTEKFDKDCIYIKQYIPELKNVPNKDILNWYKPEVHQKWIHSGVNYYYPMIDFSTERKKTLKIFKDALQ